MFFLFWDAVREFVQTARMSVAEKAGRWGLRRQMIAVDRIHTWGGLLALRSDWDRLYAADDQRDYFLSFRWVQACLERHPLQWVILVVRKGDAVVGLFPLSHRSRFSQSAGRTIAIIQTAGRLHSAQYAGLLCEPDHEEAVLQALGQYLSGLPFDRLTLENFHQTQRLEALAACFDADTFAHREMGNQSKDGMVDNLVCPYIALDGDLETWLQGLSRNRRKKLRRSMAMIDSGDVFRVVPSTPKTALAHLEVVLDLWVQQWTGLRSTESLATWRVRYWEILSNPASRGELSVPILLKEGKPVCGLGNVIDQERGHFYCIVTGRDRGVEDQDIGNMIHVHCLRESMEKGITTYDFCHGNEPYKYNFGSSDRRLKSIRISRRNAAGS